MVKTCTKCLIEKSYDNFHNTKKTKSGKVSVCKVCQSKIRHEHYLNNSDRERAYYSSYYNSNIDKERLRCKIYRDNNKDKIRDSQIRFRNENPDKVKMWASIWRKNNVDKCRSFSKNNRDTRRELLDSIKLEKGCDICGYAEHPRALQFDHINRESKLFAISEFFTCNIERLFEELDKCMVLCANCHSIHTWENQHWKKLDKDNPRMEITIRSVE